MKACICYRTLKVEFIENFLVYAKLFLTNFPTKRRLPKTSTHLMSLTYRDSESLKDFFDWFSNAKIHANDCFDSLAVNSFFQAIHMPL